MEERPFDAIVLDLKDNVATALRALEAGMSARIRATEGEVTLVIAEPIPLCHKVALVPLEAGTAVYKYGEPIGRMQRPVGAGGHVHVHNMASQRGRRTD